MVYTDAVDEVATALYVSPQYERLTGYAPADRLAEPDLWLRMLHPDDRVRVLAESDRVNETGEPFDIEYRLVRADGEVVWVHDHAFMVDLPGGRRAWQGVLTDVTERQAALDALGRRDKVLQATAFAAEHFLHAGTWEDALDEVLGRLGHAVDASRAYVFRNHTDGSELLMTQCAEWVADGIDLTIDDPENHAYPYAAGFTRWQELLSAGQVVHGPRCIWLRVEAVEGGGLIAVEDDGPGVPEELRTEIFEAFRQGPTASSHAPGTGIGLSLVARFAELHGGRAWVQERDGGGASFRVFLPDAAEASDDRAGEPMRVVEAG